MRSVDGWAHMTLLRSWLFWQAKGSAGGPSRAQVLFYLSALAKSADTFHPHTDILHLHTYPLWPSVFWSEAPTTRKSANRSICMPPSLPPHLPIYGLLFLVFFYPRLTHPFIATIPFRSLTASLICPCAYNRNPLHGSTETESPEWEWESKRSAWGRSPRFMEGQGPTNNVAPRLIKRMEMDFDRVPWGSLPIRCPPTSSKVM